MKRRLTQALGGALICAMFGCLLASYGVYSLGRTDLPWLLAIPLALAVIMVLVLSRYQRKVEALPPEYADVDATLQARDARARRSFAMVNAVQAIAIVVAAKLWFASSTPEYLAPAAAIIVAVGLVALAKPMGTPAHTVAGVLLLLLATAVVLSAAHPLWAPMIGLGSAVILWACYVFQVRAVLSGL